MTFIANPRPSPLDGKSPAEELPAEPYSAGTTSSLSSRSATLGADAVFRLGFLDSLIPLYIFDLETLKLLEVNDATVTQYGYTREELLQRYVTELQPNEEVARLVTFVYEQVPHLLSNSRMGRWYTCGNWKH